MRKIILIAVFCVFGIALLSQAEGKLLLRIDHKDAALEIGYSSTYEPEVCIALFSKQFGKLTYDWWEDIHDLRGPLSQYLIAPNKEFSCIYRPDKYDPRHFQVLGLRDTVLVRDVCYHSNEESYHYIVIKLSLDEAQELVDALSAALTMAKKP